MKYLLKLSILLLFSSSAFAQFPAPGTLDRTFGRRGTVREIPPSNINYDISQVLTQPDGKIIAVGGRTVVAAPESHYTFMLIRYTRNGHHDSTFGNDGMSALWFGSDAAARSAALQPDGKIIVAGEMMVNGNADFAMARYLPDGSLDTSFGQGGLVTTDTSTPDVTAWETAWKIFVLPDGRILLIGTHHPSRNNPYQRLPASIMITRYLEDGSLDTSYGIGGKSLIPMTFEHADFLSAYVKSDGGLAITCAEESYLHWPPEIKRANWTVKLDQNGSIDPNFGRLADPSASGYQILKVFPNDDLLIFNFYQRRIFVKRADGQPGPVILSAESIMINGYRYWPGIPLMRPDGRFISIGWAEFPDGGSSRALVRFNQDGTVDPSFGVNGISFGPAYDIEERFSLQPDGGIIQAAIWGAREFGFNLVRYSGDPVFNSTD